MDDLVALNRFHGCRVLLTGHTGFKGSWLAIWLHRLQAEVHGIALEPPSTPSVFETAAVGKIVASDRRIDIRDADTLRRAVDEIKPEIVLHLAAQAIVREGYADPLGTFGTNVMGTANLLDALRGSPARAIVVVTTDKVYENHEWLHPYRESDRLGGRDPYSASKAGTELVARAFRDSYPGALPPIATARAGNVIGGGDWSADRLLPDCMRAFASGEVVELRNPGATRPWQHVLDPLSGYLQLADALAQGAGDFTGSWNFGPDLAGEDSVGDVAGRAAEAWGANARVEHVPQADAPHEANILRLSSAKARLELGWSPRWGLNRAIGETVAWHRAQLEDADMLQVTLDQIAAWESGE